MFYYVKELPDETPGAVYRMHERGRWMERWDWGAGKWIPDKDGLITALVNGDVDMVQVDESTAEQAIAARLFSRSEGGS